MACAIRPCFATRFAWTRLRVEAPLHGPRLRVPRFQVARHIERVTADAHEDVVVDHQRSRRRKILEVPEQFMALFCSSAWLSYMLSVPVTTGFLAGIAVHIIVSQLPTVFGVFSGRNEHVLGRFLELMQHVPDAKPIPVVIGFGVLACTLIAEWLNPRIPGSLKRGKRLGRVVVRVQSQRRRRARRPCTHPADNRAQPAKLEQLARLLELAVTVALVCMMQTAAVVRLVLLDPTQAENVSRGFPVGAGSILAGLLDVRSRCEPASFAAAVVASPAAGHRPAACSPFSSLPPSRCSRVACSAMPAALAGVLMFIALRIVRRIRRIFT